MTKIHNLATICVNDLAGNGIIPDQTAKAHQVPAVLLQAGVETSRYNAMAIGHRPVQHGCH